MAKRGRRGNGEGSVYRRKDGRWVGQYTVETPAGPKRKTVYGRTRKEVAEKLARGMAERDAGLVYDAGGLTVGEYLVGYVAEVGNRVRPKTHRRYEDLCSCHLVPGLGSRKLKALAADHLRLLYADRLAAGYSARTVAHAHALLKQALAQAVSDGLIPRNVAESVKPPKGKRREINPLAPEQVRLLFDAARDDRYEALYVVAVTAGLRRGELLGLMWHDLDLAGGILRVRRTLQKDELLAPKTAKSSRQIRLTRLAVQALRRHKDRQQAERASSNGSWVDQGFIFPNRAGQPTCGDNLYSRSFRPLLRCAGLPAIRFHDLRHTCATLLLTKGVHPKIVSEMLGHATIAITLDTYSHVIPGLGDAAASAMDDALGDEADEGDG